ncbi:MAG: L-serine ammonia-lyase, iron-sulfur-dependent, subunit alpha [Clostridia bacterium]
MKSIKELYKVGLGPSSSHTMAPYKAGQWYKDNYASDNYKVILYGSLSATGKGHCTDIALIKAFYPQKVEVVFDYMTSTEHPNTMDFYTIDEAGNADNGRRVLSVGGGEIKIIGEPTNIAEEIYSEKSFESIAQYCKDKGIRLWQYAEINEGEDIWEYLALIWRKMQTAITSGLDVEGILQGGLNVERKAKLLYNNKKQFETVQTRENRLVSAYAFAVAEQNASGGEIVTAPTCGACGVLPAVLHYYQGTENYKETEILRALATAGILGNIVKSNASISGAECGCQAEIGTACAMAAASIAELRGSSVEEIEYSAEIALEHYLGLTCDPVGGLVQIPCIERNAVSAMRAINAVSLASMLPPSHKISFDMVVATMYETGKDMSCNYRETSVGGLAKNYKGK